MKNKYLKIWNSLSQGKAWSGDILNQKKCGEKYWIHTKVEPLFDENKDLVGYTSVSTDITNKKQVEFMSLTDSLTGLANRRQIDKSFNQMLAQADRYSFSLSIVMMDLDSFKSINDSYGHVVGDSVLIEVSDLILKNVRKSDIVGRWGGEEFMVICPNTQLSEALVVAETLRAAILGYEFCTAGQISSSFGVAQWMVKESAELLISRADNALYKAKNQGRNRVETAA